MRLKRADVLAIARQKTMISLLKRKILQRLLPRDFYFRKQGYCPCCQRPTDFISYDPWLRDNFLCVKCKSIPRNRALITVLEKHYPNWRCLDIHESSPSGGGASARFRSDCRGYVPTQFYPQHPAGKMINGYRNENLEAQTFDDESFDIVITQDVFEHIYDPESAFREIARTLRPGGAHVFGVPLVNKFMPSEVWAVRENDGSPRFLHEEEFHGNPVDSQGSPVTMHWGYDIVDYIKACTGHDSQIEYTDNLELGIRAEFIEVVVTRKPAV